MIDSCHYHSPLGWIELKSNGQSLISLHFTEPPEAGTSENGPILQEACRQLDEYFQGTRKKFDLPLDQEGTPFQKGVWNRLLQVPYGQTLSYLSLSKQLGNVKAIRAVASANGKNNLAIIVPCHRIIGSNQQLVGYSGGLWRKKWLLDHEARQAGGLLALAFA